jgi:ribosomal protein S18 acetylase RimI-like enzyme
MFVVTDPSSAVPTLRRMSDTEWEAWFTHQRDSYVEQMVTLGGRSRADAEAKADRDHAELLPDGSATALHHFFVAEADGQRVAVLWLAERDDHEGRRIAWVFDVETESASRRRGHGRAVMLLAEQVARGLGHGRIGLNVFARNEAAIALYRSLGYGVTRVHSTGQLMAKEL